MTEPINELDAQIEDAAAACAAAFGLDAREIRREIRATIAAEALKGKAHAAVVFDGERLQIYVSE